MFSADETGSIAYGGTCDSSTTSVSSTGNQSITFNTLNAGTYNDCTVTVTDSAGNASTALSVSSFTIDTTAPTLAEVTAVSTPTNNTAPSYVFSADETGSISYGGSCSSSTSSVSSTGNQSITFNALNAGTYNDCTVTVTDSAGNASTALSVSSFTIDTTAPTLAEVTAVSTATNDTTPSYVFSSDKTGTIAYGGACSSSTSSVSSTGNQTITFNSLNAGTYTDCTITVTDSAGNASTALSVSSFTIDTTAPTLAEVTAVSTPSNDTTPSYVFSSDKTGSIAYGGSCSSSTTSVSSTGNQTITFSSLSDGVYSNCTITVTDSAGNESNALSVTNFTVDATAPTLAEITAVSTPSNDTTPSYVFSSNETGSIAYGGSCSSSTTSVSSTGNQTVTFNTLNAGTYNDCTITVTDSVGNSSSALSVSSFTIDTTAPTLAEVTVVSTPTNDTTPNYVFSSNETGSIAYGGSCASSTTSISSTGNQTITFNTLNAGNYTDCTITVTDSAGNASASLSVSSFTIDTTAPTLAEVTVVSTPTNDNTPSYVFSSDETGTIAYGGSCSSSTTSVSSTGNQTIAFNSLSDGSYSNCTITVTDSAGKCEQCFIGYRFCG